MVCSRVIGGQKELLMIVQEFIWWDQFIRCICLSQENTLPIRSEPGEHR